MNTSTNRMHRMVSILAGCFIALVAGTRLILRLYNTHMLINETFWYLLYLLLPQLVNFGIAAVLFRGRRGPVAGCVFVLSALYTGALAFLVVHMVNSSVESFQLMQHFNIFTILYCLFYILVALDCFFPKQVWLRWIIVILPVAHFLAVMVVDAISLVVMMGEYFSLGTLVYGLMAGMPGLIAELLSGVLIGLSLLLQPKQVSEKV